jgi:5-methylthioadenosine/S-adenosylhomocysteine deaminase
VLSPAFVNAHSHLEYRYLQGALPALPYWPWIRALTTAKAEASEDTVRHAARLAARENRETGVALIAEHADQPFSGEALQAEGLAGVVLCEVITFFEHESPQQKIVAAEQKARMQRSDRIRAGPSPHSPWTLDRATLLALAADVPPAEGLYLSIHVAESPDERRLFRSGDGPIADFFREFQVPLPTRTSGSVEYLRELGYFRHGVQFVHLCDVNDEEIGWLSGSGVCVAHCPRSNAALQCPPTPVRRMLDAGVSVALGLDSAASSGAVDMFAEMRQALRSARELEEPITGREAWNMATRFGAEQLGCDGWEIVPGANVSLIGIHMPDAKDILDVIERGSPRMVRWPAPLSAGAVHE